MNSTVEYTTPHTFIFLGKIFSNFVFSLALGLRYEEEDEDGAEEGDAGEYEAAGSRADGVTDDGNQESNQEGNQPIEHCAERGGDCLEEKMKALF